MGGEARSTQCPIYFVLVHTHQTKVQTILASVAG